MSGGLIRRVIGMNVMGITMIATGIGIMTGGGIGMIGGGIGIELGANAIEAQRTHGESVGSVRAVDCD
jgi:hypothetical protein